MRKARLLTLLLVSCVALIATSGVSTASAATACPTFHVLHNDQIGALKIPAGDYVLSPKTLTCANAATLFSRFLQDWDGVLPSPWVVKGNGFEKLGTTVSFSFKAGTVKPTGGGSNITNGKCPGTFTVLHNDRIGALRLPAGQYQITTKGLLCWFDVSKLAYFLNYDSEGKLPRPWTVDAPMMKIQRSPNHYFTLKRVSSKSGGGHHPSHAVTCVSKFRVVKTTTIDAVTFTSGNYFINAFSTYSCRKASASFKSFLSAGATPADWSFDPQTATFLSGGTGFSVEPAL